MVVKGVSPLECTVVCTSVHHQDRKLHACMIERVMIQNSKYISPMKSFIRATLIFHIMYIIIYTLAF